MKISKWDLRFLELAKCVSSWSKDPGLKCGAVIVRPNKSICSLGFNGFPINCSDNEHDYEDRELKLDMVIHAETNALLFSKEDLTGYTIYIRPCSPCCRCATNIIQSGIKRIVTTTYEPERWKDSFKHAKILYKECGVELVQYEIS